MFDGFAPGADPAADDAEAVNGLKLLDHIFELVSKKYNPESAGPEGP